uniref:Reverse transcriptase Ty1/copia-type domain-containing protein n=1 Tax=Cannabis sativa TaxID=3483 RepID=A0A803QEL2_CANSA
MEMDYRTKHPEEGSQMKASTKLEDNAQIEAGAKLEDNEDQIKVEGIDYIKIFLPVVKYKAIRLMLSLATQIEFEVEQLDAKIAILSGFLDEEIYMKQPPRFQVKRKRVERYAHNEQRPISDQKYESQAQRELEMKELGPVQKILGIEVSRNMKEELYMLEGLVTVRGCPFHHGSKIYGYHRSI